VATRNQRIDTKIIFSPFYDIRMMGLELFHPFDGRKYSRIWNTLYRQHGDRLRQITISPLGPVSTADLLEVHDFEYLAKLHSKKADAAFIAAALEVPVLAFLPVSLLHRRILVPMKWATAGTVLATKEALSSQLAINLSGGFHHAQAGVGEGFCLYSDIAVAIAVARREGLLKSSDLILIIDLDAHQGNGLERIFCEDMSVKFFDMYNSSIYPQDNFARKRIDMEVVVTPCTDGPSYLSNLKAALGEFLLTHASSMPSIAFYIAGTDIVAGDPLGEMCVSPNEVTIRDRHVIQTLHSHGIPCAMVMGGGYTKSSHKITADSISHLI